MIELPGPLENKISLFSDSQSIQVQYIPETDAKTEEVVERLQERSGKASEHEEATRVVRGLKVPPIAL